MNEPARMQARDLRTNLSEVLDRTMLGGHVEITRHGRPVAVLVPADWYERAATAMHVPDGAE